MTAGLHVGARVLCALPAPYLRDYHRVVHGVTVGTITGKSALGPDDAGWLVDWGHGGEVRCEETELIRVGPDSRPIRQIVVAVKGNIPTLIPNPDELPWHHFDNSLGENPVGTQWTPRLGSQDFVRLTGIALDAGYELVDVIVGCDSHVPAADTEKYIEMVPTLLRLGQREAVHALIRNAHVRVADITVRRDPMTTPVTIGRAGRYLGLDDTAFREVFVPHWRQIFPAPAPKRPGLWSQLTGSR